MVNSVDFFKVFESISLPIGIISADNKKPLLLFSNAAYQKLLGIDISEKEASQIIEVLKHSNRFVDDAFYKEFSESIGRVLSSVDTHTIYGIKLRMQAKNVLAKATDYVDIEHNPIVINGQVAFISQTIHFVNQPEKSLKVNSPDLVRNELIETVLRNLPIGIAVNNIATGEATLMNSRFSEIYGWTEADLADVENFFQKVYPDSNYREEIIARIRADVDSGDISRMQWKNIEVTTSTGEKRVISASNIPIPGQNLMISTVVDLTPEKLQEEEIQRIKSNQDALINSSDDLMWSVDLNFTLITANQSFQRSFLKATGKSLQEGDLVLDHAYGDEINQKWESYYTKVFSGEKFSVQEGYFNDRSSHKYYSIVSFHPLLDEHGDTFGAACYSKDITAEVLNTGALEKAQSELRKIMDSSLDVICTIDEAGRFVDVSAAAERVWGYLPDELSGLPYMDFVYADDWDLTNEAARAIMSGRDMTNFENRYVRKDGGIVNIVWSARWDEKDLLMYCIAKDATEKKLSEEKLSSSEKRYRTLLENGADSIVILDEKGTANYVASSITRVLGYAEEEILGQNLSDFLFSDDQPEVFENLGKCLQRPGETIPGLTARIRHKDGSWRWVEASLTNLLHDPIINGIVDNFRDITQRKESELQIHLMINNTDEAFILLDKSLNIVSFNAQFETMYAEYFGVPVEVGSSIMDYVQPHRKAITTEIYRKVLQGHEESAELIIPNMRTKENRVVSIRYKPARDDSGEIVGVFVTVADITEKHAVLEKLKESEEKYKILFQSSPLPIFVFDLVDFNIIDVNNIAVGHYGYSREEFLSMNILDLRPESERQHLEAIYQDLLALEGVANFGIFLHRKKNGDLIQMEVSGHKFFYQGRECLMATYNDVTDREIAFKKLKENEVKLLAAQKIAKVGYWQMIPGTMELYWSDEVYNIWGVDKDVFKVNEGNFLKTLYGEDREHFISTYEQAMDGSPLLDIEFRIILPSGSVKWVSSRGNIVKDEKGRLSLIEGTVQDITGAKISGLQKTLLTDVSQHFNHSEDNIKDALQRVLQDVISYAECDLAEIWLVSADKLKINLQTTAVIEEELTEFYNLTNLVVFDKGEGLPGAAWETGEIQLWKNIDKDPKFLRYKAAEVVGLTAAIGLPLIYNDETVGVLLLGQKTESDSLLKYESFREAFCRHLGAEIKRKQLDQELKQIFTYAPDVISVAGSDGYFKKINPAACELLEYTEDELLAKPISYFVHPDDMNSSIHVAENFNDSGSFYLENRYFSKSGNVVWLAWTCTRWPEENLVFAVAKDITEKKKLEVLLEKSNKLAGIGSWELDFRTGNLFWSRITKQIHELASDYEPDLETAISFYREGFSRNSIRKAVEQGMSDGTPWDMELEITTAKGNVRWVRSIGEPEFLNGVCVKMYGSFQDVTDRKIAELDLLKIYSEKNAILESIGDGFYALDKNWNVTYWNREAENLLLFKRSEILGKNIWDKFEEAVSLKFYSEYHKAVETNEPVRFEEYFHPLKKWFEVSAFPTEDGLTAYFQDITKRRNNELELLQFKEIIENSRDGIAIANEQGYNIYINPAFSNAIGVKLSENQQPLKAYADPQLGRKVFETLMKGEYWQGDVDIKTTSGEVISYYLSGGPVFDESGELKAVYGIHTDITERKKAEQSVKNAYNERNTILESIGDGFFAIDKNWDVSYWNKVAEKLLGKTREQALGKNLWRVFRDSIDSVSYHKYHEAIKNNEVMHFEDYYPQLHKWYEISAYPSNDGLSVFFKDITERKIYDIQLKELNRVLRNNVKELAVSNRELEQFAYVASHDLQEPLRMITSFLSQLQKKYDDKLDEKAHQYINFAVDGAKRMRQIILDLLDFSRVGRIDQEIEMIDLNTVISEIISLYRKVIDESNALIVVSDLPSIPIMQSSIRQLFQNLISNALKYRNQNDGPLIEIGYDDKDEFWQFWVKDNGIGISEEYFDKIFIIFQRLHTKDQFSGTGMGLAISRKIVDNFGGKLWVESVEGKGSTFFFTIQKQRFVEKPSEYIIKRKPSEY